MAKKNLLPEEVARVYRLKKSSPSMFFSKQHGDININRLTLEKAHKLYTSGCEYLIKK